MYIVLNNFSSYDDVINYIFEVRFSVRGIAVLGYDNVMRFLDSVSSLIQ